MRFSIVAFAASAIAADVAVVWRHEKPSGSTSLTVHSAVDNTILAESCGNTLGSLDFSRVDEHGGGNFSIGDKTFDVHINSQEGVSCGRKFNGLIATTECSNVKMDVPEVATVSADCFKDEDAKLEFQSLDTRNAGPTVTEQAFTPVEAAEGRESYSLRGRQFQCTTSGGTFKVGDGNPHQNYFHKQISENMFCGASPSCAPGHSEVKSYSIGFTSEISADGWISAGFDVQKSWETGNEYTCYGNSGDTVCVWYNTAHTAYTVRNEQYNSCLSPPNKNSDPFVMKSPNKANRGGGYYCVIGTCRAQGDGYWDNSGRAGGP